MIMVTITVAVKVRPEKREEFLHTLRSLNSAREKQEGLRKCALYQEVDDQTSFNLTYEWETQEDCERYLGAEEFRVMLGALKILCEKSEIMCRSVSEELPDLALGTA